MNSQEETESPNQESIPTATAQSATNYLPLQQQIGTSTPLEQPAEAISKGELDVITKELKERVHILEDELDQIRQTNIEILAVFTALFTFVSIEFNLARKFDYLQFLYFSLFLGGLLVGFVLLIDFIIHKELNFKFIILLFCALAAILLGFSHLKEVEITKAPQQNGLDINRINIGQVKIDP